MRPPIARARLLIAALLAISLAPLSAFHAQEGETTESFEDPALPGWERTSNALIAQGVLRIEGEGYAFRPDPVSPGGLILRLRLEGEGFLEVRYRVSDAGMYILRIMPGEVHLVREAGGGQAVLGSAPSDLAVGEWWVLEMAFAEDEQHAFVGPGVELHGSDSDPLPAGGLMLHVFGNAVGEFDDLTLLPGGDDAPPEPPVPSQPAPDTVSVPSDELTWIRTGGPPGGLGYDIRYNFDDPDIWYVTDNYSGVYISTDDGHTWSPSNNGIPAQSGSTGDGIPVFCLTVDPHDPRILWAGTDITGHIYRSTDGGQTWVQRDNGVTIEHDTLTFRGFTVDPRSSDVVYAMGETSTLIPQAVGGVVYMTTDGGENWHEIWDGGMPSSLTRYLWINPEDPDILYVSTGIFDRAAIGEAPDWETNPDPFGGLGILKSTDGGQTWRVLNEANGLQLLYFGSLYMHPDNPDILLAAAGHTVPEAAGQYLASAAHRPQGIYRTTDGGETWTHVLEPPPERSVEAFSAVEMCPSDPDIAYAGSELAMYRSEDSGVTWTLVAGGTAWGPPGVRAGWPIDLQCDPRDPDRVFANNYSGGNFLSEDGGRTWQNASDGYTGAQIINLAVDPFDAAHVYAVGRSGAWESEDGGSTWRALQGLPPELPYAGGEWGGAAADPSQPDHIILGSEQVIERSGDSWHLLGMPGGFGPMAAAIAFAPSHASVVYIGAAEHNCMVHHSPCPPATGLAVSSDGGATWADLSRGTLQGQAITDLAVDPLDAQTVYAATDAGVYRSTDGGQNWIQLPGLPEGPSRMVAAHPADSSFLLASISERGLFASHDGGASWQQVIGGLEANGSFHRIVWDPTDAQIAYATDTFSGAYRSTDGGLTWLQINAGLDMRAVTGIAISADGQHVYVGTNGAGVYRLDVNGQPPVASTRPERAGSPGPATADSPAQPGPEGAPGRSLPGSGIVLGAVLGATILLALGLAFWRRRHR